MFVGRGRGEKRGARGKKRARKEKKKRPPPKKLTLRHRRRVPGPLLVHRDDRRGVLEPRLAHLAAVHLGVPALLSWVVV